MSTEELKSTNFDLSKYTVSTQHKEVEVEIPGTNDTITVTIKPLSWVKRNQLITKALTFDGEGRSSFDTDTYMRNCLKEIIVDAPWGRTTETFLLSIDARLGSALETLVPKAFNDNQEEVTADLKEKP